MASVAETRGAKTASSGRNSGVDPEAEKSSKLKPSDPHKKQATHVDFEAVMTKEEAVSYFEALVSGLKKGNLRIRRGDDSVTISPSAQVAVEVEASSKKGREKISFEIRWRTTGEEDIEISSE